MESGRFQTVISQQLDLVSTILDPNRSGSATDGSDNSLQELAKIVLRGHPLLGHLLDLSSQLDDPLSDFVDVACGHRVRFAAKQD